jgi:tryptophan 7-halogenase
MPVERIVIVGGGVAGWCAASALARKTQCQVIVVDPDGEDKSLGVPAPAISTLPSAALFHAELGHDEDAMLAPCAGTFSLGTAISGFAPGAPSFIPYGDIGAPLGPISFHHLVARRGKGDQSGELFGCRFVRAGRTVRATTSRGPLGAVDAGIWLSHE